MSRRTASPRLSRLFDKRHLLVQMGTAFAVVAVLATGAAALVAFWSAESIDNQSIARETAFVQRAVADLEGGIPIEQESVTLWDEAVTNARARDLPWIDENLGVWMGSYFGHDSVYILDPANVPIYAMRQEEMLPAWTYRNDQAAIEPLVTELRSQMAAASVGQTDSTAVISALGVQDVVRLGTRLAIASVKPIVPSSGAVRQAPGTEYLHVSVLYLGRQALKEMADQYEVSDLRLANLEPDWSLPAVPVVDAAGETLNHLQWQPYRPGRATIAALAPPFFIAILIGSLTIAWLLRRLWRSTLLLQAGEEQTRFLAFHDALTGLPNRALFDERIDRALALLHEPRNGEIALHVIDIDRFKNINDTLGHPVGDELVRQIAGRLSSVVRADDTIARIGGDEFAIIQTGVHEPADVVGLAERVLSVFDRLFDLGGEHAVVTASIGVVASGNRPTTKADLLRRADIALYEAKDKGRGRFQVFADEMDATVRRRRTIERDLRLALETKDGLRVAYQPLFAADGETVLGAEALVRWEHPVFGNLPPDTFIGIAEERGLIGQLGDWVLEQACEILRTTDLPRVAVNVSPLQFHNEHFADRILAVLRLANVAPQRLELEVTEGVLIEEGPRAEAALNRLREHGVGVVLDDFGTGYSSMSYLHKYAVDKIKIDRSFVSKIGSSGESDAIVRAIISLARAMKRRVTAEGVETIEQRDHLTALGCDELQGFLLCRPLFTDDLRSFLRAAEEPDRLTA